jgi:hypothetical protein
MHSLWSAEAAPRPPRRHAMLLLNAPIEVVRLVTDRLSPNDDAFACACACRALRDAVLAGLSGPLRTNDTAAVSTISRLVWVKSLPVEDRPSWLDTWPCGEVCHRAAKAGALPVLRWCRQQGCAWVTWQVTARAASNGHLELLQWARANGCGRGVANPLMCAAAAGGGHTHILEWLRAEGIEWGATTCAAAARSGHLSTLRWARERGCPWDESCTIAAAYQGHLDTLRWAIAQGCEFSWTGCYELAEAPRVREWLLEELEARVQRGEATAEEIEAAESSAWLTHADTNASGYGDARCAGGGLEDATPEPQHQAMPSASTAAAQERWSRWER